MIFVFEQRFRVIRTLVDVRVRVYFDKSKVFCFLVQFSNPFIFTP